MRHWVRTFCAVLLCLFPVSLPGEHRIDVTWMKGYKDASNASCCGENDCVRADITVLSMGGPEMTVQVNRIESPDHQVFWPGAVLTLPARSVHLSQDEVGYWCHKDPLYLWGAEKPCFPPSGPQVTPACTRCIFVAPGA